MIKSNQKTLCLLFLTFSLFAFGFGLAMIVLDVNVAARITGLVAVFFVSSVGDMELDFREAFRLSLLKDLLGITEHEQQSQSNSY